MAPVVLLLLLAVFVSAESCPDDWISLGDQCYWITPFNISWSSAAVMCGSLNPPARLASVHNLVINANLAYELDGRRAWLGLSRPRGTSDWHWADGSPLNYTFWSGGEPSGNGDCAAINHNAATGQWGAEDCSFDQTAICQLGTSPPPPAECPDQWSEFQGNCYTYNNTIMVPFAEVDARCSSMAPGAGAVSIHTAEQNAFLNSLQTSYSGPYLGLSRNSNTTPWFWSDGSPVDYLNWASGQPTSDFLCAYSSKNLNDGRWISFLCTSDYPIACQVSL